MMGSKKVQISDCDIYINCSANPKTGGCSGNCFESFGFYKKETEDLLKASFKEDLFGKFQRRRTC